MNRIVLVLAALVWTASASGEEQFHIEFKLYRTTVPDEERAAKEKTERSTPEIGLIQGDYVNSDAGFYEEDDELVFRPPNSDVEIRYGLVSAPRVTTLAGEESTIKIGAEVPYQIMEKDDNGDRVAVTKFKDVGTTVRVLISTATETNASIEMEGKFVTLVGHKKVPLRDADRSSTVEPILESTTWNHKSTVPYGAWLYQRAKVTLGHEFLIFARVTRFDPDAEANRKQYSIETKLLRVPKDEAARLQRMFAYDDDQEVMGDARTFRAQARYSMADILDELNTGNIELVSAPRMTLSARSLAKIVVKGIPSGKGSVDARGGIGGGGSLTSEGARATASSLSKQPGVLGLLHEASPLFNEFFAAQKPYFGTMADFATYTNPDDGSFIGFDGFLIGVQIDPVPNSEEVSLDLFYQQQYKTGGREGGRFRRAIPYTFADQIIRIPKYTLRNGDWFGIEFDSPKTSDLMLMLVTVDMLERSFSTLANEADSGTTQESATESTSSVEEPSSSVAIAEDIDTVLDIVPTIDGERVRLQAMAFQAGRDRERALAWAYVILDKENAAIIGFDFDDPQNVTQVLGTQPFPKTQGVAPPPVAGKPFHGIAIPDPIDLVAWIGPRIQEGNVRLFMDIAETKELATDTDGQRVWTNVIVRDGDGVVLGQEQGKGWSLVSIRSGNVVDGSDL